MTLENPERTVNTTMRITDGREALAQIIATALNNEDAVTELQDMLSLERDGDLEVLLAEIVSAPNELRSSSPLFSSLQNSFSGVRALRSSSSILNLADYPTFESFAEALIALDPLVEVAVSRPDNENSQIDLTDDSLLVVYLPKDLDDQVITSLTAYNKEGGIHYISTAEKPTVPVVIVRENERIIPMPKEIVDLGELPEDLGPIYYEGEQFNYHLLALSPSDSSYIETIENSDYYTNDGGGGNGGISHPQDHRLTHSNYFEHIVDVRFESRTVKELCEPWFLGEPEIKYVIVPFLTPNLQFSGLTGWKKGLSQTVNRTIFNWNPDAYGHYYLVHWVEIDLGGNTKQPFTYSGVYPHFSYQTEHGKSDDLIGRDLVWYTDTCILPHDYFYGGFSFRIKIVSPTQFNN